MRDFIPEGSPLSPAEAIRASRGLALADTRPDFIPDPNDEERDAVFLTPEQKVEAALQAGYARAARMKGDEAEAAAKKLKGLNVQDTIAFISDMSPYMQKVYVQAEHDNQGRQTVLKHFRVVPIRKDTEE